MKADELKKTTTDARVACHVQTVATGAPSVFRMATAECMPAGSGDRYIRVVDGWGSDQRKNQRHNGMRVSSRLGFFRSGFAM